MSTTIFHLARAVGVAVCGIAGVLWLILLFANPYSIRGATSASYVIAGAMIVLACLGARSSWMGKALGMGVTAVVSFIPTGLYLLETPGLFRLIGISDLVLLLAAVAVYESLAKTGGGELFPESRPAK